MALNGGLLYFAIKQSQAALLFVAIKGASPNAIRCHKKTANG